MGRKAFVTNVEDLQEILKKHTWYLPGAERVKLEFEELNENENSTYQSNLNDLLNACGCKSGAVMAIVSGLLYILFLLFISVIEINIWHLVYTVTAFFVGGLIGKVYGLFYAKSRMKSLVRQISRQVSPD